MPCCRVKCDRIATTENPQHELPRDWRIRVKWPRKLRENSTTLTEYIAKEKAKCEAGKPSSLKCCRSHFRSEDIKVIAGTTKRKPVKGAAPMSPSEEARYRQSAVQHARPHELLEQEKQVPNTALKSLRNRVVQRPVTPAEHIVQTNTAAQESIADARNREALATTNQQQQLRISTLEGEIATLQTKLTSTERAASQASEKADASRVAYTDERQKRISAEDERRQMQRAQQRSEREHGKAVKRTADADAELTRVREELTRAREELTLYKRKALAAKEKAIGAEAAHKHAQDLLELARAQLEAEIERSHAAQEIAQASAATAAKVQADFENFKKEYGLAQVCGRAC